ncbi:MAG TPA: hypothetical protein VFM05_03920 [Candidatus Saccharimonadales bacterium]|nr:hypothetical protein [Candidatus Saccharimonadales bacterium]
MARIWSWLGCFGLTLLAILFVLGVTEAIKYVSPLEDAGAGRGCFGRSRRCVSVRLDKRIATITGLALELGISREQLLEYRRY